MNDLETIDFSFQQTEEKDNGKPTVFMVGMGRLGSVLLEALLLHKYPVVGAWNRSPVERTFSTSVTVSSGDSAFPVEQIRRAKIIILAVSDHAIPLFVEKLFSIAIPMQVILHCSGKSGSQVLSLLHENDCFIGSFHPLQPVAGKLQEAAPFQEISVGIEGDEEAVSFCEKLVQILGGHTFSLEGVNRPLYHAAAVFASNYLVALADVSCGLIKQSGVTEDALPLLLPLLKNAVENLSLHGLPQALTGPIARGDDGTVQEHIASLAEHAPALLPLYLELARTTIPIAKELKKVQGRSDSSVDRIEKHLVRMMRSSLHAEQREPHSSE